MKNEFMITCSAGQGMMPVEKCLKCAQSMPTLCGFDYSLLERIYSNNQVRPDIHVTCTGSKDFGHKGRFIYGDFSPR